MSEDRAADQAELRTQAGEVADLAVTAVREHIASRPSSEDVDQRLRRLERRIKHFIYGALALSFVFVIVSAYVAIWMHELYRDRCELAIPGGTPAWCTYAFFGDDESPREPAGGVDGHGH